MILSRADYIAQGGSESGWIALCALGTMASAAGLTLADSKRIAAAGFHDKPALSLCLLLATGGVTISGLRMALDCHEAGDGELLAALVQAAEGRFP